MDHFNEIYRLQAVGAILSAMGLAEEALGDIDRLNMGLTLLGEIVIECTDEIAKKEGV